MLSYIFKKILYSLSVLFGVVSIVFILFNVVPADPARLTLGQRADVASLEAVRKDLGLDKPLTTQYLLYLNDVSPISIHENTAEVKSKYHFIASILIKNTLLALKYPYLRQSYQNKRNVTEIISSVLPKTLILGLSAMFLATIIGITLGIIAALKQHSYLDNSILVSSILGISQPSYFSGVILALIFGYWLHDITHLNYTGDLWELNDYGDETLHIKNLILPAIALGIRPIGIIVQLTRSSMIDVMSQDYIRTAYAKGLSRFSVVVKHGLRNALTPVVTAISGWMASILTGAYFIEMTFDFKGLGFTTVHALNSFDFPVAMGSILFAAVLFVIITTIVDILYLLLDPRVTAN